MKIKNLIIIGLSVIIVGLGAWIGFKYYTENYIMKVISERSYTYNYTSYVINREIGSTEWPMTSESGFTKLYVAEETSEDGNTQTLKLRIANNLNSDLSGMITIKFIETALSDSNYFYGKDFKLDAKKGSYDEFEYTVDVSDLTDAEKNGTQFIVDVCESGCMWLSK